MYNSPLETNNKESFKKDYRIQIFYIVYLVSSNKKLNNIVATWSKQLVMLLASNLWKIKVTIAIYFFSIFSKNSIKILLKF